VRLTFTPEGVELAYHHGVFPMAEGNTGLIGWYLPERRAIIPLDDFHVSRSLRKTIRRGVFEVRYDTDFEGVMRGCADRPEGTWISQDFIDVYGEMHRAGKAHCVETWRDGRLVGGTYGIALGGAYMAESMFHRETDASKVALAALVARLRERGFVLLDVQFMTPNLATLGAREIPHALYARMLAAAVRIRCRF
jgi:leucyl/phenylalanyl-tRNA---protein transferase